MASFRKGPVTNVAGSFFVILAVFIIINPFFMKKFHALFCSVFLLLGSTPTLCGQAYTSYFVGHPDTVVQAAGGLCLMGGATESDEAMQWFLRRANGGDVVVLRATGSDGYNNYFYQTLGVAVNSVETIVFNQRQRGV